MFIRIKTIQKKRYAYLVKNIWSKRKQRSRQKVVRYLGPVITPRREHDKDFKKYFRIDDVQEHIKLFPSRSVYKKLLTLELINYGFKKKGCYFVNGDIHINLPSKLIYRKSTPIVLELNEGFLCNYTLTKLYNFKTKTFDMKKEGLNFANTILQSGIKLDQEIFVSLFNKIYNISHDTASL